MSLVVESLELQNFRSYEAFRLETHERLTVIVGPNAVGKTNLIEALQVLTTTESFRRPQWADVVRMGEQAASLRMVAQGGGRLLETRLSISGAGRREYQLNGKIRRRISDVVGVLPGVVFNPDDLRLVKDPAERRRTTLDSLGVQLSPTYLRVKNDYERIVRQRNALLKNDLPDQRQLVAMDEQLVSLGTRFTELRSRLFSRLGEAMVRAHCGISPDTSLDPTYVVGWEQTISQQTSEPDESTFRRALERKRAEERARRVSLVGPHRDDISFKIDSREARTFASQGQQRTIALAWKLAEVMVIKDVLGQQPLLLLDDVMSELDQQRRSALTDLVGTTTQTIVTTTNLDYFEPDLLDRGLVVRLQP